MCIMCPFVYWSPTNDSDGNLEIGQYRKSCHSNYVVNILAHSYVPAPTTLVAAKMYTYKVKYVCVIKA